jgi:hypothetical protein
LKRYLRAALGAGTLAWLVAGCGSNERPAQSSAAIPSPNRRILGDEKLKSLIGKDGKPIWTPGKAMRPPKQ